MDDPLRFVTFLAPNMWPVYQFVADYVSEKLDRPATLETGRSFGQFAAAEADVGFICGLPYVRLREQRPPPVEPLAAPVLEGERYQDRPIYFSDVIVRRDSPSHDFAGLRGRSWSFNDPDSHSGFSVTLYWLARLGETRGFFGRVVEAGFHQNSIRLVAAGQVDASAIDSQVLAIELRDNPELAEKLRVIEAFGPSTIQPVVAGRHLPDEIKADVQAALLAMGQDPAARARLTHGFVSRFAAVGDATYDDIRQMLALAAAAGLTTIR